MPRRNANGPLGQGPRTGRGQGRCSGGADYAAAWGAGRGWGRGPCGGGRSRGRGMGHGFGYGPASWPQEAAPDLEAAAAALRARLARVEEALERQRAGESE